MRPWALQKYELYYIVSVAIERSYGSVQMHQSVMSSVHFLPWCPLHWAISRITVFHPADMPEQSQLCLLYQVPYHTTTISRPFFRDHQGEPVPEENFWTLWCKGRLTEADTPTIRLGATPSGLTSAHLHHPPQILFTGQMPFLQPNQQHQSTEGEEHIRIRDKTLEFSLMVLPAPSPYLALSVWSL